MIITLISQIKERLTMITEHELKNLIDNIQENLLISNNIISRIDYPYYYNHKFVPNSLTVFKKKLEMVRQYSVALIAKQPDLSLLNASHDMRSLSVGTFAHQLSVALTVSLFGIGDCGECSVKLGLSLIQAGFGNLAFVGIEFLDAKEGMEKYHSFIVVNLPKLTLPFDNKLLSVYDLFQNLPAHALIGDAFLGLTFPPDKIPDAFIHYINAYGGKTKLVQCSHFYNVPSHSTVFGSYPIVAKKIEKELRLTQAFLKENLYALEEKIKIEDTSLVSLLKEKAKLPFFSVRDKKYKVDAIVELNTVKEQSMTANLQRSLKGHGRFFNINGQKEVFVLEGINLWDENPKLIQNIQNLSNK